MDEIVEFFFGILNHCCIYFQDVVASYKLATSSGAKPATTSFAKLARIFVLCIFVDQQKIILQIMSNPYKLDRNAFQGMTAEEADKYQRDYSNESLEKRLEIALYLTSIAYNFDMNNPPRMDKTIFSVR